MKGRDRLQQGKTTERQKRRAAGCERVAFSNFVISFFFFLKVS